MSDSEPPSRNPFIRFKQHIDSRINTGFSVITGGPRKPETATSSGASDPELPRPDNASMAPGAPNPPTQPSWTDLVWSRKDYKSHAATRRHWDEWAESSPYSPYNLHHLEPPVPAGVTPGDAHLFGFEDAFEDLMAAAQGKPLIDLQTEADFRRGFYKVVPYGEPPQLWVDRLIRRGLLPPPPPPAPSANGGDPHRIAQESEILKGVAAQQERLAAIQSQRQAKTAPFPSLELSNGVAAQQERLAAIQSQRKAKTASFPSPEEVTQYIDEAREKLLKELDQDFTFNPATMIRQLEEKFMHLRTDPAKMLQEVEAMAKAAKTQFDKEMEKLNEAKTSDQVQQAAAVAKLFQEVEQAFAGATALTDFDLDKFLKDMDRSEEPSKPPPASRDKQKPQPDTEEDFFSAIFGALMDNNSANRPAKSATEKASQGNSQVQQLVDGERHTVEENEHGGKTHRWTSVTTNAGEVVEVIEVEILDAQGRTVSLETKTVSRTGALSQPQNTAAEVDEMQLKLLERQNKARREEVEKASQHSEGKKSMGGWFWR